MWSLLRIWRRVHLYVWLARGWEHYSTPRLPLSWPHWILQPRPVRIICCYNATVTYEYAIIMTTTHWSFTFGVAFKNPELPYRVYTLSLLSSVIHAACCVCVCSHGICLMGIATCGIRKRKGFSSFQGHIELSCLLYCHWWSLYCCDISSFLLLRECVYVDNNDILNDLLDNLKVCRYKFRYIQTLQRVLSFYCMSLCRISCSISNLWLNGSNRIGIGSSPALEDSVRSS